MKWRLLADSIWYEPLAAWDECAASLIKIIVYNTRRLFCSVDVRISCLCCKVLCCRVCVLRVEESRLQYIRCSWTTFCKNVHATVEIDRTSASNHDLYIHVCYGMHFLIRPSLFFLLPTQSHSQNSASVQHKYFLQISGAINGKCICTCDTRPTNLGLKGFIGDVT
jgi:hypothetical protein